MFEFDPAKSNANKAKHGIDFDEAKAIWSDGQAIRLQAPRPGLTEERWLVIGRIEERMWTAVVTHRGEATRIISVRRSRDDEVRSYDKAD